MVKRKNTGRRTSVTLVLDGIGVTIRCPSYQLWIPRQSCVSDDHRNRVADLGPLVPATLVTGEGSLHRVPIGSRDHDQFLLALQGWLNNLVVLLRYGVSR